jgi:periplasmic divalent cation tolerance protein
MPSRLKRSSAAGTKVTVLYTTLADLKSAKKLAFLVIKNRLAACANVVPNMKSFFFWQGQMQESKECFVLFKSTPKKSAKLKEFLLKHHPYEVPCILEFTYCQANQSFFNWMTKVMKSK